MTDDRGSSAVRTPPGRRRAVMRVAALTALLTAPALGGCQGLPTQGTPLTPSSTSRSTSAAPSVAAGGPATTTPSAAGSRPSGSGPAPAGADPVAFFRAQEPACAAHAQRYGNPAVEAERFARADLVRPLGGGSFLVADGLGTRLVVRPAAKIVLPATGKETDLMPAPYGFGCPPEVFKGAAD